MLVISCFERDAVGTSDVDWQTRGVLGLIACQRNDEEGSCGANQTHGSVCSQESFRRGLYGLNMIDTITNTADMGTEYLSATNEENVVGIDATVPWEEAWDGYDGGFERGGTLILVKSSCM